MVSRGTCDKIIESTFPSFVGRRDPRTLERVLASLCRFVAQSPATRSPAAYAEGERGPVLPTTTYNHLDALGRLRLLDESDVTPRDMRSTPSSPSRGGGGSRWRSR